MTSRFAAAAARALDRAGVVFDEAIELRPMQKRRAHADRALDPTRRTISLRGSFSVTPAQASLDEARRSGEFLGSSHFALAAIRLDIAPGHAALIADPIETGDVIVRLEAQGAPQFQVIRRLPADAGELILDLAPEGA